MYDTDLYRSWKLDVILLIVAFIQSPSYSAVPFKKSNHKWFFFSLDL